MTDALDASKSRAESWFRSLRDMICASFEALEEKATGPFFPEAHEAGHFVRTPWERTDLSGAKGGGGVM